jgi:hypothetical protein
MTYLRLMVRSALDPSRRSPTWVRVSNHVAGTVEAALSFETPRYARLLRMRAEVSFES